MLHRVQVNLQRMEAELSEADAQLIQVADALEASIKKQSDRRKKRVASVSIPSPLPGQHSKAHDGVGPSGDCDYVSYRKCVFENI